MSNIEIKGIYVTRNKSYFAVGMEEEKVKLLLAHLGVTDPKAKLRVSVRNYEARKFELALSIHEGYAFVNPVPNAKKSKARYRVQMSTFPITVKELPGFRTDDATLRNVGSVWVLTIPPEPALLPPISRSHLT